MNTQEQKSVYGVLKKNIYHSYIAVMQQRKPCHV